MRYSNALMLMPAMVLIAMAPPLSGQPSVPLGVRAGDSSRVTNPLPDYGRLDRDPNHLLRIVPATLVGVTTGLALGVATYSIADCSGSDCYGAMFGRALPAALLGGIIGSAAGAAMPRGRGLCTGLQRFGMGLGGAFLGSLAGVGLASVSGPLGIMVTIPAGSILFMRRC